jgi:hypothetical protein
MANFFFYFFIYNRKHLIIKKLLNILAKFSNWADSELKLSQLNKKVKKKICHPGDRTQAKKSNDFQKMISVDFVQPLQPYNCKQQTLLCVLKTTNLIGKNI